MIKNFTNFKDNLKTSTLWQISLVYFLIFAGFLPPLVYEIGIKIGTIFNFNFTGSYFNLAIFTITLLIVLLVVAKDNLKILNFKVKKKELILIVYGLIALNFFDTLATLLAQILQTSIVSDNQNVIIDFSQKSPLITFLITVMLAPILEELMFRVGLTGLIARKNILLAILIPAFLFGFGHILISITNGDLVQGIHFIAYFGSGLTLGFMYLKTSSFAIPFWIHFINNLWAYILLFF